MPDAIDIENRDALLAYLRKTRRIAPDETPGIRNLQGGVSNRTVLVERDSGEAWVLKQALAKLRVPVDWFSSPDRIHREALGLRWLERLAPAGTITPLIFEDMDQHLFAMQAVPQPHENWKSLLLAGKLDFDIIRQFSTLLSQIHGVGSERREELASVFADRSFFESLRLEPYYGYTSQQVPGAAGFLQTLIADTLSLRITLVHGDYSPKNVLVYQGGLVLLDHEVIHFGDPGFDLGFSLTHFLSKAHHLPAMRRDFLRAAAEYWNTYIAGVGSLPWSADLEPRAVRHTLGCLLARVAGRSPLEYMSIDERTRQREVVLSIMQSPPDRIAGLISQFEEKLCRSSNA
ncbi:MAG: phosphotransferase [Bryobacteraceae bacterium]